MDPVSLSIRVPNCEKNSGHHDRPEPPERGGAGDDHDSFKEGYRVEESRGGTDQVRLLNQHNQTIICRLNDALS